MFDFIRPDPDNVYIQARDAMKNKLPSILKNRRSACIAAAAATSVFCITIAAYLFFCTPRDEIIIGFAGSISGKDYMLGVDGRNAIELFINDINRKGGICGKKLRLITKDFKSNPENIIPCDRELINENASVIIGHLTSDSVEKALRFINSEKIVLISPTATSESLSGKDDYFFRTIMSSKSDPEYLGKIMQKAGIRRIVIFSTAHNKSYTETYTTRMKGMFSVIKEISYDEISKIDFSAIPLISTDGIVIIGSSIDSGTIAQELRIRGIRKPLYMSGWAADDDLIQYGGIAVDGAVFVHQINSRLPQIAVFSDEYKKIYGMNPSFAAIEAYDSMILVKTVMERYGTGRNSFYEEIKKIRSFDSISGTIRLNSTGDAERPVYIKKVINGKIEVIGMAE